MTEARTQPNQQGTGFDQRVLARVAGEVAGLPAIATQDWVDRVAATLAGVDTYCRVGVAIAHVESGGQVRAVEAVGTHTSEGERDRLTDPKAEQLGMRVRIERLTDLGVPLSQAGLVQGLAASAEDLGAWRDGPLGRVWSAGSVEKLLIGVVPVGRDNTDRSLLLFVALGAAPGGTARANAKTLGALIPLLARRAWKALPSAGPISWMTDREQDVMDRLILGRSVREIAEELGRSPHTVHDHVKSLHRKLEASSRGELVARALGHGPQADADIEPVILERSRAASQIEVTPGQVAVRR